MFCLFIAASTTEIDNVTNYSCVEYLTYSVLVVLPLRSNLMKKSSLIYRF